MGLCVCARARARSPMRNRTESQAYEVPQGGMSALRKDIVGEMRWSVAEAAGGRRGGRGAVTCKSRNSGGNARTKSWELQQDAARQSDRWTQIVGALHRAIGVSGFPSPSPKGAGLQLWSWRTMAMVVAVVLVLWGPLG